MSLLAFQPAGASERCVRAIRLQQKPWRKRHKLALEGDSFCYRM